MGVRKAAATPNGGSALFASQEKACAQAFACRESPVITEEDEEDSGGLDQLFEENGDNESQGSHTEGGDDPATTMAEVPSDPLIRLARLIQGTSDSATVPEQRLRYTGSWRTHMDGTEFRDKETSSLFPECQLQRRQHESIVKDKGVSDHIKSQKELARHRRRMQT